MPSTSRLSPRGFGHVETWVFDLDNTLYPHHLNLWQQVDERIRAYVSDFLKVSKDEAFRVQKDYYRRYGTTMDAGVRTAGALHQRFIAGECLNRRREQALHGELVGLDLPAGKWPPVVFDRQFIAWHITPPARRISPACRAEARPPTLVPCRRAALA